MDLKKLAAEEHHYDDAIPCPLYDNGVPEVDSKGEPVVLQILSEHSAPSRRIIQLQKQQVAKLVRRYGAWDKVPQAEVDAMADARMAACVAGWTGIESDGKPLPYSADAAVLVIAGIREYRPAMLRQIESAIAEHAAFFTTR